MTDRTPPPETDPSAEHVERAIAGLARPLLLTRAAMAAERGVRAFWPAWVIVSLGLAGLGFVPAGLLSPGQGAVAAGVVLLALGLALGLGLRSFRWPTLTEAAERLDASLAGRPIAAVTDRQAIGSGDAASATVWRAHLERMAQRLAGARAVPPDLRLAGRDRFALRLAGGTALATALIFGGLWQGGVLAPTETGPGGSALASGPAWEGWIAPPSHTGRPTIYLNEVASGSALEVPEDSRVTLRLYGEVGAVRLAETVSGDDDGVPAPERSFTVARDGEITLSGATDAGWTLVMVPDDPPEAAFAGPPEAGLRGEMTLPFTASDDYGVVAGRAEIALDPDAVDRRHGLAPEPEPREPVVLDLPLPFSGDRTDFEEALIEDLAAHPWAGLPVRMRLVVEDAAGQEGTVTRDVAAMPGRRFFDPLAGALAEQRRDLLWNRENGGRVAQVLRAVTHRPDDIFESATAYLVVRTAIRRLEAAIPAGLPDAARDEVSELLWRAALLIEEGDLSDALARLRRAQERLSEAMEQGASEQEIAQLMQELREAMDEYMRQLAEQAQRNPESMAETEDDSEPMSQQDLQDMLDRIEELFRQGRTAEAQQLLQQLRQMMENMRVTQGSPQQGQGEQAMQGLQDTLRQQQGLSDQSFRQLQEQMNPGSGRGESQGNEGRNGGQGRGQSHEGQQGQGQGAGEMPGAGELSRRQEALRQLLEDQRGNLPGGETPEGRAAREALEQADRSMGGARDDLESGDLRGALDNQADAMQALRDGIRNLAEEMANERRPGQGDQFGDSAPDSRDPLGRPLGQSGRLGTDQNMLPGAEAARRSREILEELRRRSGEQGRPDYELDYLERLLDQF